MPHIYRTKQNTRLQIIQLAAKRYIEKGYSKTTNKELATLLDISPGHITFYFPTKEHLLCVLVDELIDFQFLMMEHAAEEGTSSLLAYCLDLAAMAAICEESEEARDFFVSSYSSELTLAIIRANDTARTRRIFGAFCADWSDEMWEATENIVSGIEYATLMTREANTPLDRQIERALNSIMLIYGVPEELRRSKIRKVLAMDYRALGRRILGEFREYLDKVNEENLKNGAPKRS